MKTTTIAVQGRTFGDVVLTAGMTDSRGRQLIGVFANEHAARALDADGKTLAILFAGELTPAQLALAEANSAELCQDA